MIATLSSSSMTTDVAALHEVVFAEEGARREQWNAIVPVRTRWEVLTSLPTDWDGNGSPPPDPRVVEAAIRFLAAVAELGPGLLPQPMSCRCPEVAFTSSGWLERDSCRWRFSRISLSISSESKAGPWWIKARSA